jgi:hypothetical protein
MKMRCKQQPKVIRHGDDETGIMGIWNQEEIYIYNYWL